MRDGENTDNAKYYYEQTKTAVEGNGLSLFIQSTEPNVSNCIWFKPANSGVVENDDVLNTDNAQSVSAYFLDIDGDVKPIDNAVENESELSQGKYCFDLT